jgi:hypothetical protein
MAATTEETESLQPVHLPLQKERGQRVPPARATIISEICTIRVIGVTRPAVALCKGGSAFFKISQKIGKMS